jgi:hypothetical protein
MRLLQLLLGCCHLVLLLHHRVRNLQPPDQRSDLGRG